MKKVLKKIALYILILVNILVLIIWKSLGILSLGFSWLHKRLIHLIKKL